MAVGSIIFFAGFRGEGVPDHQEMLPVGLQGNHSTPQAPPGALATRPNTPGSWRGVVGRLMWLGSPN